MSNHEKLGQELGTSQGDVAGVELNEKVLEQVAGGDSSIIVISTIITDRASDTAAPAS